MSVTWYNDDKSGEKLAKIRIAKKSSNVPGLWAVKKASGVPEKDVDKIIKRLEKEADKALFEKEQQGFSWGTLIDLWEVAAKKGNIFIRDLNKGTVDDYVRILRIYTEDWLKLSVGEIDKAMAWRVLDKMEREISISRRKRLRTAIDAVFSWGFLSGRIKGSKEIPTEGYKTTQKEEEKMPEILNLGEIRTLLKVAREQENLWYPVWAMALLTGMRSGELYALRWQKVDFDSGLIFVHENWTNKEGFGPTKGRYWRTVPVGAELKKFLQELKLKTGRTGFVLPRFQSWKDGRQAGPLRTFCIGIGIPSVKFHTLRSCFATQLIKDGIAPAVIMKICGWKDLKTMQRYIRLAGIEVKGATEGLKILPPDQTMGRVLDLFVKS